MSNIDKIQEWYLSQCNEDWEHSFGIKIETLDNPGWRIEIDLSETLLENAKFTPVQVDYDSNTNWLTCFVEENKFKCACGPTMLDKGFELFLEWSKGI